MTNILWPSNTKNIIDSIRNAIGRDIIGMITVTGISCSYCILNPVTNLSTDPFCSGCGGTYWLTTHSGWTVNAHVRWAGAEQPLWQPGGKIIEGDCHITIAFSDENLSLLEKVDYFVVDEKEMYMKKYVLKGVPEINRIKVVLLEDPDNKRS